MHTQYLYSGLHGHTALVPFAWTALVCSVVAFLLFLVPATRKNFVTLNLGCLLIYAGVYIEKGMALVIPGMTPDTLGEIYEYTPTLNEVRIGAGIFAIGFLVFTAAVQGGDPDHPGHAHRRAGGVTTETQGSPARAVSATEPAGRSMRPTPYRGA